MKKTVKNLTFFITTLLLLLSCLFMSLKIKDLEIKISDLERTLIVKQSHLNCVKNGRI